MTSGTYDKLMSNL